MRIDLALPLGLALLEQIKAMPGVIRAELCGSLRRRRETAKDIDILASSENAAPIMDAFVALPEVVQVVGHGPTKSSIVAEMYLHGEKVTLNADLRVVDDKQFAYGLHYFTGSKEHNIRLRQRAIDQGLSLNEYALANEKKSIPAKTEADIYKALGLEYIPPELREDTGEIEARRGEEAPDPGRGRRHPRRLPQPHDLQRRHREPRRNGPGRRRRSASSTSASPITRSR